MSDDVGERVAAIVVAEFKSLFGELISFDRAALLITLAKPVGTLSLTSSPKRMSRCSSAMNILSCVPRTLPHWEQCRNPRGKTSSKDWGMKDTSTKSNKVPLRSPGSGRTATGAGSTRETGSALSGQLVACGILAPIVS